MIIKNWENIKRVVENSKIVHPKYGNVVVFTNGNEWYIDTIIKNLYLSMKIFNPEYNLLILSSDLAGLE